MRANSPHPKRELDLEFHMRADTIQLLTGLATFASGLFIPNLAKDLGASNTEIGIITAISSATAFIASYIFGRLSDIRMQLLGHRDIKTTLKYTQLVSFSYDEYVCKVAKTIDVATQLIESGYEYVTDLERYKMFRKRK